MKKGTLFGYLALSALAIGQPVLDLYGRNLTIFSVAKFDPLSTMVFVGVILLVPAVVAWVLDRLSSLFGSIVNSAVRLLLIRVFLILFLLALLNTWKVRVDIIAYPLAIAGSWLIGRALERSAMLRSFFSWLNWLPLIIVGLFLVQATPILRPASAATAQATIAHPETPVFQIIFDELPLFSILGSDGNVDAERFPGFATLQREATWFRDSAGVSNYTHQAVPAILTSAIPSKTSTPLLRSHPKNVFTLLGGVMPVDGIEPVTSLCPTTLCAHAQSERSGFSLHKFGSFMRDAAVVYARRIAPDSTAKHLPRTDVGWGGFDLVAARRRAVGGTGTFTQLDNLVEGARNLAQAQKPMYQLVHVLAPHAPWYFTPDRRVYVTGVKNGYAGSDKVDAVRDVYQRFLYQLSATDSALLTAINTLKSAGVWDRALVVVTADHGISFVPGVPQRFREFSDDGAIDEEFRVPTFIKFPNQESGAKSDCPVSNLDLLPTIVDVLGVQSNWKLTGRSLRDSCPPAVPRVIQVENGATRTLTGGFDRTLARVRYHAELVPPNGPIWKVAAVGAAASLIGTPIGAVPPSTEKVRWTLTDADLFANMSEEPESVVPYVARGGIILQKEFPAGTEGIIVLDGIAAGVVGEFSWGSKFFTYQSVLDYRLLTKGAHTVRLVLRDPTTGALTDAGPRAAK